MDLIKSFSSDSSDRLTPPSIIEIASVFSQSVLPKNQDQGILQLMINF